MGARESRDNRCQLDVLVVQVDPVYRLQICQGQETFELASHGFWLIAHCCDAECHAVCVKMKTLRAERDAVAVQR